MDFRIIAVLISIVVLWEACTDSQIKAEYDPETDFSSYKTYTVCTADMEVENQAHPAYDNVANREQIKQALQQAMNNRGYIENNTNPQLLVGFHIALKDRQIHVADCKGENEYKYWEGCKISTYTYTDGTLVIYVTDLAKNRIIWQGAANSLLDASAEHENAVRIIETAVEKIFKEYPIKEK